MMAHNTFPKHETDYPPEIDYSDPTNRACDSIVTAFLAYRIGAKAELWQPSAIDKISGRSGGTATQPAQAYTNILTLLENGAEIVETGLFDTNRLLKEGRSYLEEFYKKTWLAGDPEGFGSFWDSSLSDLVDATLSFDERIRQDFSHTYTRVLERPTLDSLETFTNDGYVSKCVLTSNLGYGFGHAVVALDVEGPDGLNQVKMFNPSAAARENVEGPILSVPRGEFNSRWMKSDGVLAVRRADY